MKRPLCKTYSILREKLRNISTKDESLMIIGFKSFSTISGRFIAFSGKVRRNSADYQRICLFVPTKNISQFFAFFSENIRKSVKVPNNTYVSQRHFK